MRNNRAKIIVTLLFVVTLVAGVATGLLVSRFPGGGEGITTPPADPSLPVALNLTPDQRQKMQEIWEGVRDLSEQSLHESTRAEQTRDREIAKLIPLEKSEQFNAVWRTYAETNAKLIGARKAAFEHAVEQSRTILNAEQQKKYSAILAQRLGSQAGVDHDPLTSAAAGLGAGTQPEQ